MAAVKVTVKTAVPVNGDWLIKVLADNTADKSDVIFTSPMGFVNHAPQL
jgi:hypothetical protein